MTIEDLKNLLDEFDPHTEVRFAMQPEWPMEHYLRGVYLDDGTKVDPETGEVAPVDPDDPNAEKEPVLYLVEGGGNNYLPGSARGAFDNYMS